MSKKNNFLTPGEKAKMAVHLIPVILEREKRQDVSQSAYQKMIDDNVYLASSALDLVEAIERESLSRQSGGLSAGNLLKAL